MNFFTFWKMLFCFAWLPIFFGGKSSSNTASTTNNIDQRLLLEDGGLGVSASGGSNVTVNALDAGAIKESFGLADAALNDVVTLAESSISGAHYTTRQALSGALSSVEGSRQAFADALGEVAQARKDVATAYEDSKIGNRVAVLAGAAVVVVIVALAVLKKGRA